MGCDLRGCAGQATRKHKATSLRDAVREWKARGLTLVLPVGVPAGHVFVCAPRKAADITLVVSWATVLRAATVRLHVLQGRAARRAVPKGVRPCVERTWDWSGEGHENMRNPLSESLFLSFRLPPR